MSESEAGALLESEVAQAARRSRRATAEAAFRATVEARLGSLESEVREVKDRVNGLLFFLAGTVIAQALLRLLA